MAWLPSPLWFTGIGVACLVAAGAAIFFLKMVSVGFDLGIAAGVLFLLAACAHTYTARGEANVQAKFDAYKTAQAKEAADIKAQQVAALATAQTEADARLKAEKDRADGLNAQVAALQHRNVMLSRGLSNVLRDSSAATHDGSAGPKPGGQDAAATVPGSTSDGGVCYDEQALGGYFAATRAAYDSALNAWRACVADFAAIRAPTLKGQP